MTLTLEQPVQDGEFHLGSIIQFKGTASSEIVSVNLVSPFKGKEFNLNTTSALGGSWAGACSFNTGGNRIVFIRGVDESNSTIEEIKARIKLIDYAELVNIPPGINAGLSSAKLSTMESVLGTPCIPGREHKCHRITNASLEARLATEDVGPFRVTGLKPAIEALKRIFSKVKAEKPELYQQLGTAGMLCCRFVKGSTKFSNHSWGAAIDLKISSQLDAVGDGKAQAGLVAIAPYFHAEGFFWGAGFSSAAREDSMHFEASEQLILEWKAKGLI